MTPSGPTGPPIPNAKAKPVLAKPPVQANGASNGASKNLNLDELRENIEVLKTQLAANKERERAATEKHKALTARRTSVESECKSLQFESQRIQSVLGEIATIARAAESEA